MNAIRQAISAWLTEFWLRRQAPLILYHRWTEDNIQRCHDHRAQYEMEGMDVDRSIAFNQKKAKFYFDKMHPRVQAEVIQAKLSGIEF